MVNKNIIAFLSGGLGNQLFVYAAALEQADRIGVNVLADVSWFYRQDKRVYLLGHLFPNLQVIGGSSRASRTLSKASSILNRLRKHSVFVEKGFYETKNSFDDGIFSITEGTRLRGYFQSTKYFPSSGALVAEAIRQARVSKEEQSILDDICSRPFNAIHVRRGDYFHSPSTRDFHGLTTKEYFEAGSRLFGNSTLPCLVFSDSPQIARKELDGVGNFVFDPKTLDLGDVATLKLMSYAKGLVISNSSFSWWAAYTISQYDACAVIVTPRPWSKEIDVNHNLIHQNWINLSI